MKKQKLFSLLALMLASQFCAAQDSAFYVGAAVGNSTIAFGSQDFGSGSPSNARESTPVYADIGYKLMLGYLFNENWSVEGGYTGQGRFQFRSKSIATIDSVFDYAANSWFLTGKLALPIAEKIAVFGKWGVTQNTAKVNYWWDISMTRVFGVPPVLPGTVISVPNLTAFIKPGSYSETVFAPLVGVGIEYAFAKNSKVRLEYENYGRFGGQTTTGRSTNAMTSLGIVYSF